MQAAAAAAAAPLIDAGAFTIRENSFERVATVS